MSSLKTVAYVVVMLIAGEETKVEKKEVTKTFECKFYNKELKGCGAKCPKNRNICCYYCPMYARCITIPEIAADICDQVKEVKC